MYREVWKEPKDREIWWKVWQQRGGIQTLLAERMRLHFEQDEWVNLLTEALTHMWQRDKEAIELVKALGLEFPQKEDDDLIALRAHLREVYETFPLNDEASNLRKHMLKVIIQGWRMVRKLRHEGGEYLSPDAEDCFTFLCRIGTSAPGSSVINDVLREHLRYLPFRVSELTPWILRDEVPEEIVTVLLHARINAREKRGADGKVEHGTAIMLRELRQLHGNS